MNAAGPANWNPAELTMNRTIPMKMTTMSNEVSVRVRRTGATSSEAMVRSSVLGTPPSRTAMHPPLSTRDEAARARDQGSPRPYPTENPAELYSYQVLV